MKNYNTLKAFSIFSFTGFSLGAGFGYLANKTYQLAVITTSQVFIRLMTNLSDDAKFAGIVAYQSAIASGATKAVAEIAKLMAIRSFNAAMAAYEGAIASGATKAAAEIAKSIAFDAVNHGQNPESGASSAAAQSTILGSIGSRFNGNAVMGIGFIGLCLFCVGGWYMAKKSQRNLSENKKITRNRTKKKTSENSFSLMSKKIDRLNMENEELRYKISQILLERSHRLSLYEAKIQNLNTKCFIEPAKDTPDRYICPITKMIIKEPIIPLDKHPYEKEALIIWFQSSNKCPLIPSLILTDPELMPIDFTLKAQIMEYIQSMNNSQFNLQ